MKTVETKNILLINRRLIVRYLIGCDPSIENMKTIDQAGREALMNKPPFIARFVLDTVQLTFWKRFKVWIIGLRHLKWDWRKEEVLFREVMPGDPEYEYAPYGQAFFCHEKVLYVDSMLNLERLN